MKTIWKFYMPVSDYVCVGLPKGYKILKFGKQGADYYIWALVDPKNVIEFENFAVKGTGHPLDEYFLESHKYIDSWIESDGGQFVWHLFEQVNP